MNRRILFFLAAALASGLLIPGSPEEFRWVTIGVAVTYTVLAILAALEVLDRNRRG